MSSTAVLADTRLQGAGSTFVNPMMQRWVSEYQVQHGDTKIDYESTGSGGGVKAFLDKTVDFAASDAPLNKKELVKAGGAEKIIEFPVIAGGVVPAYNLPGVNTEVKFSGPVRRPHPRRHLSRQDRQVERPPDSRVKSWCESSRLNNNSGLAHRW